MWTSTDPGKLARLQGARGIDFPGRKWWHGQSLGVAFKFTPTATITNLCRVKKRDRSETLKKRLAWPARPSQHKDTAELELMDIKTSTPNSGGHVSRNKNSENKEPGTHDSNPSAYLCVRQDFTRVPGTCITGSRHCSTRMGFM